VVSDVPAYAIVGGVPARVLRMRVTDSAVEALERLRRWDWPVDAVAAAEPLLRVGDWAELERFASDRGLVPPEAEG